MSDHRFDDDPITRKIKLYVDILTRVGFPILICAWLLYERSTSGREMLTMLTEVKEVISSLKLSVDQQTKALKRKTPRGEPEG